MSEQQPNVLPPVRPRLADSVHYVSFGTPGGEYPSRCRAATITAAGAWIDAEATVTSPGARTLAQRWDPLAAGLFVANPTGLFVNPAVRQDPAGRPGTWHYASWCPHRA